MTRHVPYRHRGNSCSGPGKDCSKNVESGINFLPKNRVCRGGVGSEFTMEKFAKYYLDQMIKISVTSDKVC